ncbi:MAG: hypothetical protein WDN72_01420 [Alphaproteobacteria bacterium]
MDFHRTLGFYLQHPSIADAAELDVLGHGLDPIPKGVSYGVYMADYCPHCKISIENNGQLTSAGRPIFWFNDAYDEIHQRLQHIPGIDTDPNTGAMTIHGVPLDGFPIAFKMVDGRAVEVLHKGELPPKWFDTQAAQEQARQPDSGVCRPFVAAGSCHADVSAPPRTTGSANQR